MMALIINHCQYAKEIMVFLNRNKQKKLTSKQFHTILSLYEKWWISVQDWRSRAFERQVLHYIAERAFWSDFQDGEYVARLMVYLYQADNHFGLFLFPESDFCISLGSLTSISESPSRFFLNHAYRQRLTIQGTRIMDLKVFSRSLWLHPCEMAVINESPTMLRCFLQFGALLVSGSTQHRASVSANLLKITLCIIKTIIMFEKFSWSLNSEPAVQKYNDMTMCGRLILRASPQFDKRIVYSICITFPGFRSPQEAIEWVGGTSLSELKNRINFPLPLKHACRLRIRNSLYQNWQLPFGIEKLDIPSVLKDYINLDYD